MNVILDAGHGIDTPGKRSRKLPDGRQLFEWSFDRRVCESLYSLGDERISYAYHRFYDDIRLGTRVARINAIDNIDLVLSIHGNAAGNGAWQTRAYGARQFVSGNASDTSHLAAMHISKSMSILPHDSWDVFDCNRDIRNFWILKRTKPPAVLIECSFFDNPHDVRLMLDIPGLYANLIHKGVLDLQRKLGR